MIRYLASGWYFCWRSLLLGSLFFIAFMSLSLAKSWSESVIIFITFCIANLLMPHFSVIAGGLPSLLIGLLAPYCYDRIKKKILFQAAMVAIALIIGWLYLLIMFGVPGLRNLVIPSAMVCCGALAVFIISHFWWLCQTR